MFSGISLNTRSKSSDKKIGKLLSCFCSRHRGFISSVVVAEDIIDEMPSHYKLGQSIAVEGIKGQEHPIFFMMGVYFMRFSCGVDVLIVHTDLPNRNAAFSNGHQLWQPQKVK